MTKLLLALGVAALPAIGAPRHVTLVATGTNVINTATLTIAPFETAEVVSFPSSCEIDVAMTLGILTGAAFFQFNNHASCEAQAVVKPREPLIVAGPGSIKLSVSSGRSGFCTVRLTPDSYPPDKSILLAPGTNRTVITMEYSTNLVEWFTATNGVYGPLPEAKFFRIKANPAN